jgi:hypothetical protein
MFSNTVEDEDLAKLPFGCRYGGPSVLPAYHLSGYTPSPPPPLHNAKKINSKFLIQ